MEPNNFLSFKSSFTAINFFIAAITMLMAGDRHFSSPIQLKQELNGWNIQICYFTKQKKLYLTPYTVKKRVIGKFAS